MSDIQRSPTRPTTPAQQHRDNVGKGNYNRYGFLSSVQKTASGKSSAQKRPRNDGHEPDNPGKIPKLDANKVFDQLKVYDTMMTMAKTTLTEVGSCASKVGSVDDGTIGTAIYKLGQVLDAIISSQEALKSTIVDMVKLNEQATSSGDNIRYIGSVPGNTSGGSGTSNQTGKQKKPAPTKEEIEKAKVKKVLREAERRIIAFDLDLGTAPIMNKTTISKNVTVDLHNRAKSGNHDWAVDSAATMVDDVLSCAQLEFLGSGTRRFHNNRDPTDARNNRMCTVPVRFDFKNKDQRIRAETAMKKICKVRTAVPYPKRMREALASLVIEGKTKAPGKFVMTKVDVENLTISAHVRGETGWVDLGLKKDISSLLVDTTGITINEEELQSQVSETIEIS